jgi:hypothetical protein
MNNLITSGILKNCDSIYDTIGVDKDLILVNYIDFNSEITLSEENKVLDPQNINYRGISKIILNENAQTYVFEGSHNSVIPTVTNELREDNKMLYSHEVSFIAYSKKSEDRKIMESLSKSKVIAITKDLSTGLYELFGGKAGLTLKSISRQYSGSQNSNFYSITLATPEIAFLKEDTMGELSEKIILLSDGINIQESIFKQGDSQIFETSTDYRYIYNISINGINIRESEYEILSESQIKIIKTLVIGDTIILKYSYQKMEEREEFVWISGSQTFSLANSFLKVINVFVNGIDLSNTQFSTTIPNKINILDTLNVNDGIIINYEKL